MGLALVLGLVPCAVAACGGRTFAEDPPDGGPNSDAASCVTIDVSTYDRSCQQASDCVTISAGTFCDGECGCGGSTINADGQSRYAAQLASITQGDCFCPNEPTPECIENVCTICTGSPTDPPGCESIEPVEAGTCVDVDLTTYDQTCRADSDCIEVTAGEICADSCECGGSAINQNDAQRYANATDGITTEACPCPYFGNPRCVAGSCAICPDPSDPNQPAACVARDAGDGDN
jgi:hypothetical protein